MRRRGAAYSVKRTGKRRCWNWEMTIVQRVSDAAVRMRHGRSTVPRMRCAGGAAPLPWLVREWQGEHQTASERRHARVINMLVLVPPAASLGFQGLPRHTSCVTQACLDTGEVIACGERLHLISVH